MTDQDNILGYTSPDKSMPEHDALHALVKACISQNRAAQKELYVKYSPLVYGIIRRYEYDQHIGQEILSDAFMKIFTKLHLYSFKGAFEGWIRKIVVNTITDHARKNIKHNQHIKHDVQLENMVVSENVADRLTYKELLKLVYELPGTQRTVFNLFVFESFSHKDISEHLGITENNSRWHLNDARRRLKEKINNM